MISAHVISAWACDQQLVPGQCKIDDKSNEITAIPELLALLALKGAIVTIDAMGCQRRICRQIIDQQADYVIGLKGNQGSLRDDVELFPEEHPERDIGGEFIEESEAVDADHGRIETRRYTVCSKRPLRDGGHDHLRVGPGDAEAARAMSDEETFHRAKALFDAEPSFGNLLVEAFLRLAQRAVASRLAHDAIAMLAFQGCPIGFTGTGFVGQHTLCSGSLNHRARLRTFARVGRGQVNLVDIPRFVCAGKALPDPTGILICTVMHIRVILCVAFFAVLRGLNMRTRTGGTLNQGCIDNGRLGFPEPEAVTLDLAANLNRKSIIDTNLDQGVTKPTDSVWSHPALCREDQVHKTTSNPAVPSKHVQASGQIGHATGRPTST